MNGLGVAVGVHDDAASSGYEVPVVQPSGKRRGLDEGWWSRPVPTIGGSMWVHVVAVVFFGSQGYFLVGGTWVTQLVFGIATVLGALGVWPDPLIHGELLRRRSRTLQAPSWRAATVRVFSWEHDRKKLLLVDNGSRSPLRLRPDRLGRVEEMVLARTRRIWLAGPDADGRYLYCCAGLCTAPGYGRVVDEQPPEDSEIVVEDRSPALLANAADDVVSGWGLDGERLGVWRGLLVTGTIMIGFLVLTVVLLSSGVEHAIESTAVLGILTVLAIARVAGIVRRLWLLRRITRLRSAGPWTLVPVTLHEPVDRANTFRTYRGVATMPDGRTVPVGVRTEVPLAANIAATGLLWTAGEPTPGRALAVGLPGYPHVGLGRFGR